MSDFLYYTGRGGYEILQRAFEKEHNQMVLTSLNLKKSDPDLVESLEKMNDSEDYQDVLVVSAFLSNYLETLKP